MSTEPRVCKLSIFLIASRVSEVFFDLRYPVHSGRLIFGSPFLNLASQLPRLDGQKPKGSRGFFPCLVIQPIFWFGLRRVECLENGLEALVVDFTSSAPCGSVFSQKKFS